MAITDGTSDRTAAAEEDENSTVTLTLPGGFDCNGQQFCTPQMGKWMQMGWFSPKIAHLARELYRT